MAFALTIESWTQRLQMRFKLRQVAFAEFNTIRNDVVTFVTIDVETFLWHVVAKAKKTHPALCGT
jgi:hypothetical protein